MRVEMAAMKRDAEHYSRQVMFYCKNIYFAGHEPTATATAWCLMLLALHPEWQARIREETLQEATWLRATLHKWLDDEYCPEASNVEIIQVAADSYHKSLLEKETDLGEILLKMATDLGQVSFQEIFHGAFSLENAAVNLIVQRIEQI